MNAIKYAVVSIYLGCILFGLIGFSLAYRCYEIKLSPWENVTSIIAALIGLSFLLVMAYVSPFLNLKEEMKLGINMLNVINGRFKRLIVIVITPYDDTCSEPEIGTYHIKNNGDVLGRLASRSFRTDMCIGYRLYIVTVVMRECLIDCKIGVTIGCVEEMSDKVTAHVKYG